MNFNRFSGLHVDERRVGGVFQAGHLSLLTSFNQLICFSFTMYGIESNREKWNTKNKKGKYKIALLHQDS